MKKTVFLLFILMSIITWACQDTKDISNNKATIQDSSFKENIPFIKGDQIKPRIATPAHYKRTIEKKDSYEEYLRSLKLKESGAKVHYYDGRIKQNYNVYQDIVDLPIDDKDLHQCADAVMRLRAEYLWESKEYDKIQFNFTNGHTVKYAKWRDGYRMQIEGNNTRWIKKKEPSNSYADFWKYMELIFMYAGTASLEKELKSVDIENANIGDIFIQGGHPGHAVVIVDKAKHVETGKAIYLLAQSYMPAQEIQILVNRNEPNLSPWYRFREGEIHTPEWQFSSDNLKRFK